MPVSRKSPFFLLLAAATVLLALGACGGGSGNDTSQRPDPEQTVRSLLDALNNNDVQTFYNGLSSDRRQAFSLADIQRSLDGVRSLVGTVPKIEVTTITAKRIKGDNAEVDGTLTLKLAAGGFPVTATALLKWEDNRWHLADHFLDQALGVLGLQSGGGAPSPTVSPTP
jgi:hypothetical protein